MGVLPGAASGSLIVLLIGVCLFFLVVLVIGVLALRRVDPAGLPEVLRALGGWFPWNRGPRRRR
ncbi:hypothetical protein ACFY1P_21790 [Streptomyces sp. NPDC001407]|uniref:hypothetical protein n=1 Tax=Streptomyces sp. NPDC001407 TaxID=3364573 RepID=UPI0036B9B63B